MIKSVEVCTLNLQQFLVCIWLDPHQHIVDDFDVDDVFQKHLAERAYTELFCF